MAINAPLPQLIQEGFGFPNGKIRVTESYLTYTGLRTEADFEKDLAANPNAKRQANISLVLVGHQLDDNDQIVGDPEKPIRQYLRATGRNDGWYDKNGNGGTEASYRLVSYNLNKDGSIDLASIQHLEPNLEEDAETGKLGEQPVGVGIDFPGTTAELGRNTAAGKYIQELAKLGLDKTKIAEGLPITGIVPITFACHTEKREEEDKTTGSKFSFSEFHVDQIFEFPYDAPAAPASGKKAAASTKAAAATAKPAATPATPTKTAAATKATAAKPAAAPALTAAASDNDDLIKGALDILLTKGFNGTMVELLLNGKASDVVGMLKDADLTLANVAAYLTANGKYESEGASVEMNGSKWLFKKA